MLRKTRYCRTLLFCCSIIMVPSAACADVVWPALYVSMRMHELHWLWAVILGLLAEWPFYRAITKTSWARASIMTIVANAISAIIGIVAVPASGFLWEIVSIPIHNYINIGTFSIIGWVGTVLFAALTNSLIEGASLRLIFKTRLSRRTFSFLLMANIISLAIVVATIFVSPIET